MEPYDSTFRKESCAWLKIFLEPAKNVFFPTNASKKMVTVRFWRCIIRALAVAGILGPQHPNSMLHASFYLGTYMLTIVGICWSKHRVQWQHMSSVGNQKQGSFKVFKPWAQGIYQITRKFLHGL